jgi:hypothetical protein
VAHDLADATIPALSEDRRFATAYNAALQTGKMAIACAGYRIASVPGHHRLTFEGAKLAVGKLAEALADYFDSCRRKRNEIDYTGGQLPPARKQMNSCCTPNPFSTWSNVGLSQITRSSSDRKFSLYAADASANRCYMRMKTMAPV